MFKCSDEALFYPDGCVFFVILKMKKNDDDVEKPGFLAINSLRTTLVPGTRLKVHVIIHTYKVPVREALFFYFTYS